jgi:ribokinase
MVVLNPAPFCDLPADLLKRIDCLIPNDVEAGHLSGIEVTDLATTKLAASLLLDCGVPKMIITLGQNCALLADGRSMKHVPAYPVEAIDATAAGDAFIGFLAVGLARSETLLQATELASACGALTTTKLGAQASLPNLEELNRFLKAQGKSADLSL